MPDICIFYSEPDESKVEVLPSILEDFGWSAWWNKDIKNGRWGSEIEPPFPFDAEHITSNVSEWDYSDGAGGCVGKIVEDVESVLGIAPKK